MSVSYSEDHTVLVELVGDDSAAEVQGINHIFVGFFAFVLCASLFVAALLVGFASLLPPLAHYFASETKAHRGFAARVAARFRPHVFLVLLLNFVAASLWDGYLAAHFVAVHVGWGTGIVFGVLVLALHAMLLAGVPRSLVLIVPIVIVAYGTSSWTLLCRMTGQFAGDYSWSCEFVFEPEDHHLEEARRVHAEQGEEGAAANN